MRRTVRRYSQYTTLPFPDASAAEKIDEPSPVDRLAPLGPDVAYSIQQTAADLVHEKLRELEYGRDRQRSLRKMRGQCRWRCCGKA